jgi:hypothetical protein
MYEFLCWKAGIPTMQVPCSNYYCFSLLALVAIFDPYSDTPRITEIRFLFISGIQIEYASSTFRFPSFFFHWHIQQSGASFVFHKQKLCATELHVYRKSASSSWHCDLMAELTLLIAAVYTLDERLYLRKNPYHQPVDARMLLLTDKFAHLNI